MEQSNKFCGYRSALLCISAIWIICGLSACSTPIKVAGEQHHSAAEKWKALSQYTSSDLPLYGLTVIARLEADKDDGKLNGILTGFRLAKSDDAYSIDLLAPSFEQKFICPQTCIQLVEYNDKNDGIGDTFLTRFVDKYEFRLFSFYSELFVLNDDLALLEKENAEWLDDYLLYLSQQQVQFSSLKEITHFLSAELTLEQYRAFLSSPEIQYENAVKNNIANDSEVYANIRSFLFDDDDADDQWTTAAEEFSYSSRGISANDPSNDGTSAQRFNDPSSNWQDAALVAWSKTKPNSTSSWLSAKNIPLKVGSTVCTYKQNYFGTLDRVNPNGVEIFVQGLALNNVDGVITMLEQGSLFKVSDGIEFLPLYEKKVFPRADIARCNIQ
ncbi:hypothetical protein [Neptunicella sp. SCSIO 80796]|uniref:hypothetical protein n=1 Tax=Neptunicella plasticusilytica TaxID=3117012 RepID=UPI003A4DB3B7